METLFRGAGPGRWLPLTAGDGPPEHIEHADGRVVVFSTPERAEEFAASWALGDCYPCAGCGEWVADGIACHDGEGCDGPTIEEARRRFVADVCPSCGQPMEGDCDGWHSMESGDNSAWQDRICDKCDGGYREVLEHTSTVALDSGRGESHTLWAAAPAPCWAVSWTNVDTGEAEVVAFVLEADADTFAAGLGEPAAHVFQLEVLTAEQAARARAIADGAA